jgi:hypothetical protein
MNAIELIDFIKEQPLISHAVPVLADGKPIVSIELIEDSECGYAFNLIIES